MTTTVASIVLMVVGAAVVLAVLVVAVAWVLACVHERVVAPWVQRIEQSEYERGVARLRDYSWWFSEDAATMHLVRDLGSGIGVEQSRENWRRARKVPEAPR